MVIEDYDSERSAKYSSLKDCNVVMNYVDKFTVKQYLLPLENKSVLDVGCGEGQYCRLVKKCGAGRVVGIDMSEHMIQLSKEYDEKEQLHCQFQVCNVETSTDDELGEFDYVMSNYVLVYAENAEHLSKFCEFIYKHLKKGGRCVAIIRNCLDTSYVDADFSDYGYSFQRLKETSDGGIALLTQITAPNGESFKSTNFSLKPETYEKVFLKVGFSSFALRSVLVDDKYKTEGFPENYWENYLKNPHQICIVAEK